LKCRYWFDRRRTPGRPVIRFRAFHQHCGRVCPLPECGGLISAVQRLRRLFPPWLSGETASVALLHPDCPSDFFDSYCPGVLHGYDNSTRKNHSDNLHGWLGVERRARAGRSSRGRGKRGCEEPGYETGTTSAAQFRAALAYNRSSCNRIVFPAFVGIRGGYSDPYLQCFLYVD
jgi:hypothetical protein